MSHIRPQWYNYQEPLYTLEYIYQINGDLNITFNLS